MATPKFNGTELTSNGERDFVGRPRVRLPLGHLPGVNGAFASPSGTGERYIFGWGYLQAHGAAGDAAQKDLKTALRGRQALASGWLMSQYESTDTTAYGDCFLLEYNQAGPVEIQQAPGTFTARIPVSYRVVQMVP